MSISEKTKFELNGRCIDLTGAKAAIRSRGQTIDLNKPVKPQRDNQEKASVERRKEQYRQERLKEL